MKKFYPKNEKFKNSYFKNMNQYRELVKEFDDDYEGTWSNIAINKIDWFKLFDVVLEKEKAPFYKWFTGGKMNVAYQCIEPNLKKHPYKNAIIFEADNGEQKCITYQELSDEVSKCSNMFKNKFNIEKGDRVIIYMPMIPEAAIVMLACAKIGAIHSIVFGGFSSAALKDRIIDAKAKLVITADGAFRKGKSYMLKPIVDIALETCCESVKNVCIIERNNEDIYWKNGRDYSYNDLIKNESNVCEYEHMNSDDALFILYTSGSTGKPKGVVHSSAGYILWARLLWNGFLIYKKMISFGVQLI